MKAKIMLLVTLGLMAGCTTRRPVHPLSPAALPEPGVYLVQPGDGATLIARNLCVSVDQLAALNPGVDWSHLKIGQKLRYATAPFVLPLRYHNAKYDLTFYLPESWHGYSVLIQPWEGETYFKATDKTAVTEHGQMITLRHPQWKASVPYQDIQILVFTRRQWDALHHGKFWPTVFAGGAMDELWHNNTYVFGMSSRYNSGELNGSKEVAEIVGQNSAAHPQHHLYPE